MHILLDECVPRAIREELDNPGVTTVRNMRLNGLRNGQLLAKMRELGFTVLVTVDRNLSKQQKLADGGVAVIVLEAISNRLEHLIPLIPKLRVALNHIQPGEVIGIQAEKN